MFDNIREAHSGRRTNILMPLLIFAGALSIISYSSYLLIRIFYVINLGIYTAIPILFISILASYLLLKPYANLSRHCVLKSVFLLLASLIIMLIV